VTGSTVNDDGVVQTRKFIQVGSQGADGQVNCSCNVAVFFNFSSFPHVHQERGLIHQGFIQRRGGNGSISLVLAILIHQLGEQGEKIGGGFRDGSGFFGGSFRYNNGSFGCFHHHRGNSCAGAQQKAEQNQQGNGEQQFFGHSS